MQIHGLSEQQQATVAGLDRMLTWARRLRTAPGISTSTLTTLDTLTVAGPLRISELAEREGISQPGMTGLINRLESQSLVGRAPDPSDGRACLITVTPAGRRLIEERRARRSGALAHRLADLSAADQDALFAALPALARLTS